MSSLRNFKSMKLVSSERRLKIRSYESSSESGIQNPELVRYKILRISMSPISIECESQVYYMVLGVHGIILSWIWISHVSVEWS